MICKHIKRDLEIEGTVVIRHIQVLKKQDSLQSNS